MDGKYTYYDLIAHLVPGTLMVAVLALLPEVFNFTVPTPKSDVVTVVAGLPLTYAVGQVVQAIASFLQPIYYRLWGGMPSDRIAAGESDRLRDPRLAKVMSALGEKFHSDSLTIAERKALFYDAMALCNHKQLGRVDEFNASYAFHRALLTTGALTSITLGLALALAEFEVTSVMGSVRSSLAYFAILAVILTAVEFVRTRQRGEYFSVEVLNMAYVDCVEGAGVSESEQ